MSGAKPIQIARPGRYHSVSGHLVELTEEALAASARAYDPAVHEAPIVVGHPRTDAPAYGWIGRLRFDGALEAEPQQVDPAFAETVREGRWKKVSAAFYGPSCPTNPVPGVYYLRHVGFLGAAPPGIKGLRAVELAEHEEGVVEIELAELEDRFAYSAIARVLRALREWFIAERDTDTADRVVPDYEIQALEEAARPAGEDRPAATAFSEPPAAHEEDPTVTPDEIAAREAELREREAALASEREALEAREAAFAEREQRLAQAEAERQRAETAAFVEGLVKDGKVLPREQAGLVELLLCATPEDIQLAFAEGDEQVEKPARAWLREFLEGLPKRVDFAERAPGGAAPDDPDDEEIAAQARVYRDKAREEGRNISFAEAVDAVRAGQAD